MDRQRVDRRRGVARDAGGREAPAARHPGRPRVPGVDAARGLAVLGMFAAHVGDPGPEPFRGSTGWLAVADGRSAALFAVLAGVSISLMSGGPAPVRGLEADRVRVRVATRAVFVAVVGYGLAALGTPVQVILPAYALMFVLVLPVLLARRAVLVAGAGVVALGGPLVVAAAGGRDEGFHYGLEGLLVTGYYPAAVWLAYLLTGMAVGRLDMGRRTDIRIALVLGGSGLAAASYSAGAVVSRTAEPGLAPWFSVAPHADTTLEVLGNTGTALAVLGILALLAPTRAGRLLLGPVAATGMMALTVYAGQIVALAVLGPGVTVAPDGNAVLASFVVVTLAVATVWTRLLGRGPLERAMRGLADATGGRADPGEPTAAEKATPPETATATEKGTAPEAEAAPEERERP